MTLSQTQCASVGHQQVQVFVYRCEHVGSTHVTLTGGTTDDPIMDLEMTYGPFDDVEWIARDITSIVVNALGRLFG